ncbi:trypsin-like serine protease [Rhodococcus spelaei]|uniref:Trypsin-like serine protease n=1 Tax=Rhodococcus spelaei TaxID=2546320 RepID=A0A541BRB0_9NOCA|nr:trypsin-like peptidase domain-containing protein [Rhodococcus spelaei]TQF74835.1 trypsin-like serine protease [Rhodococcus spelaei]
MDSRERDRRRPPRHRGLRALLLVAAVAGCLLVGGRLGTDSPTLPNIPAPVAAPAPAPVPLAPAEIAARVVPTIVTITSAAGPLTTAGTGIVLTPDGVVLTNHHVIDGATDISATTLVDGSRHTAQVLGYDRFRDVAVLRLDDVTGLPTATLGRSADLHRHDPVIAIGNAEGGGIPLSAPGEVVGVGQSVTARNASDGSRNRLTGMIEVDADIRPGDSGGPLVDAFGKVVGVSTAGNTGMRPAPVDPGHSAGSTPAPDSPPTTGAPIPIESYAIPIDDAVALADQIRGGRTSETVHIGPTPLLGVAVTDVGETQSGAKVVAVGAGSPAEQAGIARGDVIVSWGANPIRSSSDLTVEMTARHPGDRVDLGWVDGGGRQRTGSLTLTVGAP